MTLNAATISPSAAAPIESEVSLTRLYALRAMYLLLVTGGTIVFLPQLIGHEPAARGVIPSMLGGLWVLACFGLRYPLQMLPILLFELVWRQSGSSITGYRNGGRVCTRRNSQRISKRSRWA
jgi:hypothetical protein